MKLPASLLSHLRVSLAAGAVVATGCDLAAEDAPQAAQAPAQSIEATPVEAAESAPAAASESPGAEPDSAGIAAVARAAAEGRVPSRALETPEDPTAFVPFSAGSAEPSRVKPREEAPLAFAEPPPPRPRPRVERAKPAPKPVKIGKGWDCPACGRG